jgi:hypothetical protein
MLTAATARSRIPMQRSSRSGIEKNGPGLVVGGHEGGDPADGKDLLRRRFPPLQDSDPTAHTRQLLGCVSSGRLGDSVVSRSHLHTPTPREVIFWLPLALVPFRNVSIFKP